MVIFAEAEFIKPVCFKMNLNKELQHIQAYLDYKVKMRHTRDCYFLAALFAIWCLFRLCFLANFMFFKNLGSQPEKVEFYIMLITSGILSSPFMLMCLLREGFLSPLRWSFLLWLWAVWFLDLAILNQDFWNSRTFIDGILSHGSLLSQIESNRRTKTI